MNKRSSNLQYKILIADDEAAITTGVSGLLQEQEYQTIVADNGISALQMLEKEPLDLVLVDLMMPGLNGLELLEEVKQKSITTPVIIITGKGTIGTAVEAIKAGAFDYLTKPVHPDRLRTTVKKALEHQDLILANKRLEAAIDRMSRYEDLIGQDDKMREVYRLIEAVADTDASVIITGESGTGKELVARAIHRKGGRAKGPLVAVNCSAFPKDILENELFGHEKGAFTGAVSQKSGCFELANGGTLFLDEIAEMPADTQTKLLRALEEQRFRRLGGTKEISVNVRIIAATNRDLKQALNDGILREDLYYRLCVMQIKLPSLRDRMSDLPLLLAEFLKQFNEKNEKDIRGFSAESLSVLANHHWPGNVRELRNLVERAVILCMEATIQVQYLPEELIHQDRDAAIKSQSAGALTLQQIEKEAIFAALKMTGNNKTKAAQILDISLKTLHNKLNKYYLERETE